MADVFISYSRRENTGAELISKLLEKRGLDVFLDVEIGGGEDFAAVIDREVKNARAVIGLWSTQALKSQWIKSECLVAHNRGVLIPVMTAPIADADVPVNYALVQRIDLSDFDGKTSHAGWRKLILALANMLGRPDLVSIDRTAGDLSEAERLAAVAPKRPRKRGASPWLAAGIAAAVLVAAVGLALSPISPVSPFRQAGAAPAPEPAPIASSMSTCTAAAQTGGLVDLLAGCSQDAKVEVLHCKAAHTADDCTPYGAGQDGSFVIPELMSYTPLLTSPISGQVVMLILKPDDSAQQILTFGPDGQEISVGKDVPRYLPYEDMAFGAVVDDCKAMTETGRWILIVAPPQGAAMQVGIKQLVESNLMPASSATQYATPQALNAFTEAIRGDITAHPEQWASWSARYEFRRDSPRDDCSDSPN